MIIGTRHDTAETIVEILAKGSCTTLELEKLVAKERIVTKQGFYKALRKLVQDEVVEKNKQSVFLSNVWVTRMHDFLDTVDATYQEQTSRSLVTLSEGESLTYSFRSIGHLDTLWMHYFFLIAKEHPAADILMYDAHEFWSLVRPGAQKFLYEWIKSSKRNSYVVIGSNTELDKKTTSYIKKLGSSVMYEPKASYPKNYFTLVIGDYVIDSLVDKKTGEGIDKIYKTNPLWNEETKRKVISLIEGSLRHKIVITRDIKRAMKIRKQLMKYFKF